MSARSSLPPDLARARRLVVRAAGGFGTSILAGGLVGGGSWLSDELGYPLGLLLPANLIGVWLAIAFGLGGSARSVPTGALRGLIGLLSAVAVYYLLFAVLGDGIRAIGAGHAASIWGGVALVAGPLLGGAGASWRHGRGWPRAVAVAGLAAALLAEGIVFGAGRIAAIDRLADDPGALILAAEMAIGAALPWLLLRPDERLPGYAATASLTVVGAAAIGPLTTFLRAVSDRF
jgi:hypothetical protein